MTQQQKEQISKLRASGASFGKIASVLGVSVNTVKSYCKRNPISAEAAPAPKATSPLPGGFSRPRRDTFITLRGKKSNPTEPPNYRPK